MKKLIIILLLSCTYAFAQGQQVPLPIQKTTTISPCAGGNSTIPSTISGSSYQWQVNAGSGYTNLSNGGIYSGTTTNTLQITGAPTSLYGYQYRCMVDGNFSAVYVLIFVSTWVGSIDNNWENGSNWNCGSVPDANTDVVVNSGSPILNSNRSVRTLTTGGNNTVTVKTGFVLTVAH